MDILRARDLLLSTEQDILNNVVNKPYPVPLDSPNRPFQSRTNYYVGDIVGVMHSKEPQYITSWGYQGDNSHPYVTLSEHYGRVEIWKIRDYKPISLKEPIRKLRENLQCVNLLYVGEFAGRISWELIKITSLLILLEAGIWVLAVTEDTLPNVLIGFCLAFLGIGVGMTLPKSIKELYTRLRYTRIQPRFYDDEEEE